MFVGLCLYLRSCKLSGAIMWCSWFFTLQELNWIGAMSFLQSKVFSTRRGVMEKSFLKSLIGVNYWSENKRVKNFGVVWLLNKGVEWKEYFLFITLFPREWESEVQKKDQSFLFALLKQFFLNFFGFFYFLFVTADPRSYCGYFLAIGQLWSIGVLFFNSRTAIAEAIIGLLLVFFISSSWFLLRPYDVTATFCSFVHAISTELHVWRHFSLLVERVFLFMRVIKFLVTLDLPHSQKWLPHFEIDFYLL